MEQPLYLEQTHKTFFLFGGLGGGALGLQQATADYRGVRGKFEVLGSVDVDSDACADFETLTGIKATAMDLFDREQYTDWHGKEPPADWQEVGSDEIRAAAQGQDPDVVVITAPCKGFSGLLSEEKSVSRRYQALNKLTFRGVFLTLEAWRDNPPGIILFENVPRIATRGKKFLSEIKRLLKAYGYLTDDRHHDCGELGGLAQHRRRYLLIARHQSKLPAVVYNPPKLRVRAIGEVIGPMPMPDDPASGPLHRLPRLQWKTWVRLSLIRPGGDWRDLQHVEAGQYRITPEMNGEHTTKYRVHKWDEPSKTVTGSDRLGSGAPSIADVRLNHTPMGNGKGSGAYHVQKFDEPSKTLTGDPNHRKSGGNGVVADPRIGHSPREGSMQVGAWDEPSGPVVGSAAVTSSNAIGAVADIRFPEKEDRHASHYRVTGWAEPGGTVTGATHLANGSGAVADPRLDCEPRSGTMGVLAWDQAAPSVIGAADIHNGGAAAVADPRIPEDSERGVWVIVSPWNCWHRPLTTLELMALQGFPTTHPDGSAVVLAGKSDKAWRERVGNAVPPPTMQAIGEQLLLTFLTMTGDEGAFRFNLAQTGTWVQPLGEVEVPPA